MTAVQPLGSFEVVAHRGARTLANHQQIAPENTMPSFEEAAKLGASIELDVIATTDGRIVVHHDDKTGRVFKLPGGDRLVRESSFADMQGAVLNEPGHEKTVKKMLGKGSSYQTPSHYKKITVPELETVLTQLPNTRFYVELKTDDEQVAHNTNNDLGARVVKLIQEKNLYDRVTVISFSPLALRRVKQLDPKIRTGLDFNLPHYAKKLPLGLKYFINVHAKRWAKVDDLLPNYRETNAQLVKIGHKAGMRVLPWVSGETRSQEQQHFPQLINLKVDGLISNAVDLLNQTLGR